MEHENTSRQLASQAYRLPVEDLEFLLRDEMRGLRFALEYSKAELLLRDWGIRSTMIVFGSARMPSPEQAERLRAGEAERRRPEVPHGRAVAGALVRGGARVRRIASKRGGASVRERRDATTSSHRGRTGDHGGGQSRRPKSARPRSGSTSPCRTSRPNGYSTPELTFRFHYFAMRKMHLAMRANALVVFPGGFGTLDELFEILTLRQTGKSPPIPIVLFDEGYWRSS